MSGKIRNPTRRCKICGGKCNKQMRYCKLCAKEQRRRGMTPTPDLSDFVSTIEKAKALAFACQDSAERMRYAQIKRTLEHDFARATGLKDFGFIPREGEGK